jgi:hypothetical protein
MNIAAAIARAPAAPVADILGEKLRLAVARWAAWRESGDSPGKPGWRERFRDWRETDPVALNFCRELDVAERRLAEAEDGRIRRRLHGLFRLSSAEADLLDSALALVATPALGLILEGLEAASRTGGLTQTLVADLFAHPGAPILRPSSPLLVWGLVEQSHSTGRLEDAIVADPDIAAAVFGRPGLDRCLAQFAHVAESEALPVASWPVERTADEIARLIAMDRPVRVAVRAAPGEGRLQFACAVTELLGSKVLAIAPDGSDGQAALGMRAQRVALLTGHAIYWQSSPPPPSPMVAPAPIQFVALDPAENLPPAPPLLDLLVDLPHLGEAERELVWRSLAPEACREQQSDTLVGARIGDLLACAAHAPRSPVEAAALIASRVRTRLESAGNLLSQPYDWPDLVLPPRQQALLQTIVGEIRSRGKLLASGDRLAKYGGLGQSALLHGPPGTGKTMVAQILARDLSVQLVRVDCASVVSKYIGDTARNLRNIFDCVGGSGALLFFDECDSLFARRTEIKDAHDRHANADTNYLLQLIESFDGAALLATNKKDNVDPAFIRRLRHVVDFPAPGRAERKALWERHIAALSDARLSTAKVAGWAERLAELELTPAQIKGAALSAAFLRLSAERRAPLFLDFIAGVDRELAKDARGIDRQLRERLMRHG